MKSNIRNTAHFVAALLTLIAISSCTSTKLTSVWMDEKKSGKSYDDILIIGISDQDINRRLFEEQFASQLKAAGVESEVSYSILPKGTKINRDTVSAAIKGKDIDAVIVTHMVSVEEKKVFRQSMGYAPGYGYYDGLYNYYPYVNNYVNQPGYYDTAKIVHLETNLYEANSDDLVWTAQSQSFAPESAKEVIDELVKLAIKDLKQKGLIKTR